MNFRYKVLKEGVIFGIKENLENHMPNFWAVLGNNNETRLLVELDRK